jgi:hypothetical protein
LKKLTLGLDVIKKKNETIEKIFFWVKDTLADQKDWIFDKSGEFYNFLKKRFIGQDIAFLGPTRAGKTSLIKILMNPNINIMNEPYQATRSQEIKSVVIHYTIPMSNLNDEVKTIPLKVPIIRDIGGEVSYRDLEQSTTENIDNWESVVKKIQYIYYLFNLNKFLQEKKYKTRVLADMDWIASYNQVYKPGFGLICFGTFLDNVNQKLKDKHGGNNFFSVQETLKKSLGDFSNHLIYFSPIDLTSRINRPKIISNSLYKIYLGSPEAEIPICAKDTKQ